MTRDDIIRMAREADMGYPTEYPYNNYWTAFEDQLIRFAELVAAHEREACARVCLDPVVTPMNPRHNRSTVGASEFVRPKTAHECAATIRARGQQ